MIDALVFVVFLVMTFACWGANQTLKEYEPAGECVGLFFIMFSTGIVAALAFAWLFDRWCYLLV